jgi:adenylate kinase
MSYDDERQSYIVDTDKLEETLKIYLKEKEGTIILEGHYGDIVPNEFVNKCFVLSSPPVELRVRLAEKDYPPEKIEENLTAEIMNECWLNALEAFGPTKVTKIDNMSITDIVSLIETYLQMDSARSHD